jgi:ethanolaminephosphotransferase
MSAMASNYDMVKLVLGPVIAGLACVLATAALLRTSTPDEQSNLGLGAITLAYGVMMFASSYVEEEQHFWYWATTAWMASLVVRYKKG